MSDSFWDSGSSDREILPVEIAGNDQPRMLLPLALAGVIFIGATMPWIVIRPMGSERNSYNLTDVPGGVGILVTIFLFVLVSSVVMIWKRVTGMVLLSLSLSMLGWMAGISGMLLGLVGSLIPAIEIAGIDLSKAQVGQGPGVVICVLFNLLLAFLCVRKLEPFSRFSRAFEFPVVQIAAVVPAVVITLTIHEGWLVLGNPDADWRAEVPGDSLYGSGLLVVGLWLVIGFWLTSAILRTSVVIRVAGALSVVVSIVAIGYTLLVWIGGKALAWLLPGSVEGWASVSTQPSLVATALAGLTMGVLGIVGILTSNRERVVRMAPEAKIGSVAIPTSDMFAYVLILFSVIFLLYRTVT